MAKSSNFVVLVAAGVLGAAGLLVPVVLVVQERSVEATSPGKPGRIAHSAYDGTNVEIYTIDSGGGGRFQVTDNDGELPRFWRWWRSRHHAAEGDHRHGSWRHLRWSCYLHLLSRRASYLPVQAASGHDHDKQLGSVHTSENLLRSR